jgi:23S rRNA (uracil1939-C5)-methyltransferase
MTQHRLQSSLLKGVFFIFGDIHMTRRHQQLSVPVQITEFTKKGNGLGKVIANEHTPTHKIGAIVEVPFTLPGDTAQVALSRKKNGVFASRLEEIITPSSDRIQPRCIHFASCGGCRWQHLAYPDQLTLKQKNIEILFAPLLTHGVAVRPIVACDPPWAYRNKMEFTFSGDAAGKKYLGLILDSSRGKVLNMTECHLVNTWFVDALKVTRAWWHESDLLPYHPHTNTGSLRTLIVREGMRTGDRLVMLTVSGCPEYALHKQQLESFTAFLRDAIEPVDPSAKLSIFLRIQQAVKGKETQFYEMLLYGPDHIREILHIQTEPETPSVPLQFSVSPSAFFQPNTRQAEKLYSLALQMLDIPSDSVVYDLYCGTGTLGICAAKKAKQVLGIEISPESSLDARTNASMNNLKHVNIVTGPVHEVIAAMKKEGALPPADVVMVDPPRSGLDSQTIQHLVDLKPTKLLYISCNPNTQVENIKELQEKGYRIAAIQPVDQFPHTVHIENIVVLESVRL